MTDLRKKIEEAVRGQVAIKEHFIAQYLHATGAKIEDTVLVEQKSDDFMTIKYWCEPNQLREKEQMNEQQKANVILHAAAVVIDVKTRTRFDWLFRGPTVRVSKHTFDQLVAAVAASGFDLHGALAKAKTL